MGFLPPGDVRFGPNPVRMLAGAAAAAMALSALAELVAQGVYHAVLLVALTSMMLVFLPTFHWRLPRVRYPLLECLLIGAICLPAPIAVSNSILLLIDSSTEALSWLTTVVTLAAPFGALGGFVFWLVVVWRNPDCVQIRPNE